MTFTHLESGTSEHVWASDERMRRVRPLDAAAIDHLIVVSAHPDDETLGAAGIMQRVSAAGGRVTVIVATDGEASHPHSTTHTPADLRSIRRREVRHAADALAPGCDLHFLGLPDGGLRERTRELEDVLAAMVEVISHDLPHTTFVAPWSGDGHRDHRVTAECVARVASATGICHLGYPIWLWHWGRPDDVPWEVAVGLELVEAERSGKGRALSMHVSQTSPLSAAPGDEAIISDDMKAHFSRPIELFIVESTDVSESAATKALTTQSLNSEWFDDFYKRNDDDPWGFETRWYEERKRAVLMASLTTHRLGKVLEIGCSTGHITRELAARADHVLALDASEAALEVAQERLASPSVTLTHGHVPDDWPGGSFDTIVFSEVGYYLSVDDLERTIELIDAALSEGGHLVACHWRHPVVAYPQTGDSVHAALRAHHAWERLVLHEEEDFVLEVFGRRPTVSVARREGIA
ncbi:PIG-L family deacetylase [Microbacterium lacus]|uniref:PIG-L family deacetylase n=1 Tax=Microbacterium lacus TaxID=415217 RepID=UPI0038512F15